MYYFLHIELVLLLGAATLDLALWLFSLFKRQLLEFFFKLVEALFVGVEEEDLQEEVEEVDYSVGVAKYFLVRIALLGYRVGLSAHLTLEIFYIREVAS
jgi:hypothetical protein